MSETHLGNRDCAIGSPLKFSTVIYRHCSPDTLKHVYSPLSVKENNNLPASSEVKCICPAHLCSHSAILLSLTSYRFITIKAQCMHHHFGKCCTRGSPSICVVLSSSVLHLSGFLGVFLLTSSWMFSTITTSGLK